jgi:predicted DNA-binding protein
MLYLTDSINLKMEILKMKEQTKCLSVNLPLSKVEELKAIKEQTGKSQNEILTESILNGIENFKQSENQLFLVKVRIDTAKMMELGQKLKSGELDKQMIKFTYCLKSDPTVGVSLWTAKNKAEFDRLFAPHKEYYKDIIEVFSAIKPEEAMTLIMQEIN